MEKCWCTHNSKLFVFILIHLPCLLAAGFFKFPRWMISVSYDSKNLGQEIIYNVILLAILVAIRAANFSSFKFVNFGSQYICKLLGVQDLFCLHMLMGQDKGGFSWNEKRNGSKIIYRSKLKISMWYEMVTLLDPIFQ